MTHHPIPLAAAFASLRASAEADAVGEPAYNVLQALIMACLARIFARLEDLFRLWQAGLLPPAPVRSASPARPAPAPASASASASAYANGVEDPCGGTSQPQPTHAPHRQHAATATRPPSPASRVPIVAPLALATNAGARPQPAAAPGRATAATDRQPRAAIARAARARNVTPAAAPASALRARALALLPASAKLRQCAISFQKPLRACMDDCIHNVSISIQNLRRRRLPTRRCCP